MYHTLTIKSTAVTIYGMVCSPTIFGLLEFFGAIRHEGNFLHLSHYHRMSGLAQKHKESVNTKPVLILKPYTATPMHMPHLDAIVRHLHQISKSSTAVACD